MRKLNDMFSWYFSKKALPYWAVLIMDLTIIVFSELFAIYLGNNFYNLYNNLQAYLIWCACSLPMMIVGMRVFHTYSSIIRYSSFVDLLRVTSALCLGIFLNSIIYTAMIFLRFVDYGELITIKMLAFTLIIAMIIMWAVRILVKYLYDIAYKDDADHRVFIYGVREGGISIAKSMRNEHPLRYLVKGFVTFENEMTGRYLLGTYVYGPDDKAIMTMKKNKVDLLFVSPFCTENFRKNTVFIDKLVKAGIKIMMMPTAEVWDGTSKISHSQLKEVDIEDLLPRDKIEVDMKAIGGMLKGKKILITGAAGSIGSEMVRQVAKFALAELILIDQAETPMYDVRLYMSRNHENIKCYTIVSSIINTSHMEMIFKKHRPEYVFHAAAYKHVPMMEDNPALAIQNNIYGTHVIADLAVKYGTKKFVMISTDKAVNPTNVMGCSKRICEIYCQSLNNAIQNINNNIPTEDSIKDKLTQFDGKPAVTQFITTRFGNVLGSNGSVIPIFKRQIKRGGPVTVTHPDIIRFFMLIPEACQLVLEAGTMGHGGEIFVFDMGKPIRIANLAQRMIDMSGASGIEIQYTGLRDGEKLYEEVLNDEEQTKPTHNKKIKIATVREYSYQQALKDKEELLELSFTYNDMEIVKKMKEIVPEYKSQHSKYEDLD